MIRTLDHTPRFDERSLAYRVAAMAEAPQRPVRRRRWGKPVVMDQGPDGYCVGYSAAHALATTPRPWPGVDQVLAERIYHEAQVRDQWPGEDYVGSSVLGAMQYLSDAGKLRAYWWCTSLSECLHALSYLGPVVIGVSWYESMFSPAEDGSLTVSGDLAGGHAVELLGVDPERRRVLLANSWGPGWGLGGSAWLSYDDADRLLHEDGEFAVPRKRYRVTS